MKDDNRLKCVEWETRKEARGYRSFGRSWYGPQQGTKTDINQPKRIGSGREASEIGGAATVGA